MDASDSRCLRDLEVYVLLKIRVDQYDLRFPLDCTFEFIFDLAWLAEGLRHLPAPDDHESDCG